MKHNWLRLDKVKEDSFRGECDSIMDNLRTFGGQVLAQALNAAYSTVPAGFSLNSFHCYFIRGGEEKVPIIYEVKHLRNGRNFVVRTVEAIQHGKVIHTSEFSFQNEGKASKFKVTPKFPSVPSPESLRTSIESKANYLENGGNPRFIRGVNVELIAECVELRPCDDQLYTRGVKGENSAMKQYIWIKYNDTVDVDEFQLSHATLAYLSDLTLVNTAMLPFKPNQTFRLTTSLDHSLWLHEFRFDVNEWLLYEQECMAHSHDRSMVNARIWSRSGSLLASTSQEVLLYLHADSPLESDEVIKSKL